MILKNQPRTALAVAVTLILLGAAPAVRADLSFTAAQQPASALAYTSGGAWVNYQAINNNGDIAGQISADGEAHYLGFVNNNVLNYGTYNIGNNSQNFNVTSINDAGDIIGTYDTKLVVLRYPVSLSNSSRHRYLRRRQHCAVRYPGAYQYHIHR